MGDDGTADGGFVVDGPYLRDAARELTEALASARQIVARATTENAVKPDGWLNDAGSPSLARMIMEVLDTSAKAMAGHVAKGDKIALGLLTAADRYDVAEAEIAKKLKANESVPPMLRVPIEQQLTEQQQADIQKLDPSQTPRTPPGTAVETPAPFDMTK